jgi:hypothetical protein
MNWLKNFMIGRYGNDQLSMGLIILTILLLFIASLINLSFISFIAYIPLIASVYRSFSKDIEKRKLENYKFMVFISPFYSWFRKTSLSLKDSRTFKYYNCPNCNSTLRLPKGKGKINISCPKCKTEFIGKT